MRENEIELRELLKDIADFIDGYVVEMKDSQGKSLRTDFSELLAAARKAGDYMKVKVPVRNSAGYLTSSKLVAVRKVCPVCGGPRGEARPYLMTEDGWNMSVDRWDNPCGHVDKYADVLREAGQ